MFIGIDPGKSGAIASILETWELRVEAEALAKMNLHEIADHLEYLAGGDWQPFAFIEKVHSMPGQGVASTFAFGRSFGQLEMALASRGIPFDYVTPSKWQKEFGLTGKKDETKTEKKNRHKALAQRLFPQIKVTHATADALLLAEYCRRVVKK